MSGAGSDSGFLSSGDSSVNGDYTNNGNNNCKITNNITTSTTTTPWGDKSIWGAPLSPITNYNANKEVWSNTSANNLWDSDSSSIQKSSSQEWLGSIWMIPQTPKTQNICETPNSYQAFKSDITGFQLMRPHDIGNNMWNNTAAAASMSGIKVNPSATTNKSNNITLSATASITDSCSKNPNNTNRYIKSMRINTLAYGGGNQQLTQLQTPVPPPQYNSMQAQTTSLPQPSVTLGNSNNINTFDMAQNACLQLFSDDFLNYFNTIH